MLYLTGLGERPAVSSHKAHTKSFLNQEKNFHLRVDKYGGSWLRFGDKKEVEQKREDAKR